MKLGVRTTFCSWMYFILLCGQSASAQNASTVIASPPPAVRLVKGIAVVCPDHDPCQGVFGKVRVRITVDSDGVPTKVIPIEGDERLYRPVEEAVSKYRFKLFSPGNTFEWAVSVPKRTP